MLAHPGFAGARHAGEQKGAIGGKSRDSDLYQAHIADVLWLDLKPAGQRAAQEVRPNRPGGELPVRWPLPVVGGSKLSKLAGVLLLDPRSLHPFNSHQWLSVSYSHR